MLTSMTGFGREEVTFEGGTITVEIKSVNHRYSDFSIRLPRKLSGFENQIKELIKERIHRGYVTCNLTWDRSENSPEVLSLNENTIRRYLELFNQMGSQYGIEGTPTVDTFSSLDDIFIREAETPDMEKIWEIVRQACNKALDALVEMRVQEGQVLALDIEKRLSLMAETMKAARSKAPERQERLETRLRQKVKASLSGEAVDENRVIQEITIYADKWDFSEEEVRFSSHLGVFREALKDSGPVGRKLNFLLQELNREVNTVGSKANDAEIAQYMVAIKEEIEKIREQVENIE